MKALLLGVDGRLAGAAFVVEQGVGDLVGAGGDHPRLDVLALPVAPRRVEPEEQRRRHAERPVGVAVARVHWRVAAARGPHSRADDGRDRGMEGGLPVVRPRRTVGAGVQIDEARVHRRDRLVVEAEALVGPGPEVVHQGVRPLDEAVEDLPPALGLQIDGDALLALDCLRRALRKPPHRVAARRLDLDHAGPEVGEQGSPERRGVVRRQFEDGDALQRRPRGVSAAIDGVTGGGKWPGGEGERFAAVLVEERRRRPHP